jgi:hypothetical protein
MVQFTLAPSSQSIVALDLAIPAMQSDLITRRAVQPEH